ncbi:MAG: molybdopterin-dependent oxidoreductase [Nitrospinae bacterium]|nr:molybdopterin-dependent oxidoreductase [Nitrospinota bacterium]
MDRRSFLKIGGVAAAAGATGACGQMVQTIIPYVAPADEGINPVDGTWYYTTCKVCNAGCGVMVRTVMGRAKKIEGNPSHPVNFGGVCARGQAAVHQVYHPERIKKPLVRTGAKGANTFKEISWDEALALLGAKIKGADKKAFLMVSNPSDVVSAIASKALQKIGSDAVLFHDASVGVGEGQYADMAKAGCVLLLGADIFESGGSPVHYGDRFGRMRRGDNLRRGMMMYAGPRMSLTAASADMFIAAEQGTLGLLALGIAKKYVAILKEKKIDLVKGQTIADWEKSLAGLEDVSKATGVPDDKISKIAKNLFDQQPSAVIAGEDVSAHSNGAQSLAAVEFLNMILRATCAEKTGFWNASADKIPAQQKIRDAAGFPTKFAPMKETLASAGNGKMNLAMIIDSDPVHGLPAGLNCKKALEKTGFVAYFGCFLNDTTQYADLVLPENHFLEAWSAQVGVSPDGTPYFNAQQPVIQPLYKTMQSGDAILKACTVAGLATDAPTQEAYVLKIVDDSKRGFEGVPATLDGKKAWEFILQRGFAIPSASGSAKNAVVKNEAPKIDKPVFAGGPGFEFFLHPYATANLGCGKTSNISWLLEMPEPMTSIKWGSWVEINPKTAAKLGIKDGDILKVESQWGSIDAPASVYPGIGPQTLAVPLGFGHEAFGKHATKRGGNVMSIIGADVPLRGLKVKITKTGKNIEIIREGNPKGDYEGEVFQL